MKSLAILSIFSLFFSFISCEVSDEAKNLARMWSPLVWIHSQDEFYPSDVDFYMANMEVNQTCYALHQCSKNNEKKEFLAFKADKHYKHLLQLRDITEDVWDFSPSPSTILTGELSRDFHLNTHQPIECVHCTEPHFYGQTLQEVINNIRHNQTSSQSLLCYSVLQQSLT